MTEALRLADAIDPLTRKSLDNLTCASAATELRRLHALNAELVEALRQIATSQIPIWHRDLAREVLEKMEASK